MTDLFGLALRLGLLLLLSPVLLGGACVLTALYGLGSDWPVWAPALLGLCALVLWGRALFRLIRG